MLDTLRLETGDPPHPYRYAALAALAALVPRPLGCYESLHPQRPRPPTCFKKAALPDRHAKLAKSAEQQLLFYLSSSSPSSHSWQPLFYFALANYCGAHRHLGPHLWHLCHLCTTSRASAAAPTVACTFITAPRPALPKPDHRLARCSLPSAVCQSARLLRYCVDNSRHHVTRPQFQNGSLHEQDPMDVIRPMCSAQYGKTLPGRQFYFPAIGLSEPSCA